MKNLINKILFVFVLALIINACSAPETIILDRKISVVVPAIKDSMRASLYNMPKTSIDSLDLIFASLSDSAKIEGTDEVDGANIKISFFPKKKIFVYSISKRSVDTTFTDTTSLLIKKETTTPEKFGYAFYGIIGFLLVVVLLFFVIKK
jgi:hypothetical protein